ncbi:MAG: hypothetical protein ACD_57C00017G0003 [uncultured bacterium]|uniref:Plasmid stabilization protein n=1 Tax=Candidatus Woesebacteria bacterium RIFCSPLOWO2_01_FULL_39_21 TaxID=1802519 RepID=A0A1F8BCS3_9BACT|nr:MAG: hypothetical protein ACD_57C00017G0003 [uncultured bacterium]OGM22167.1 MAG: hypothetical protein A2691_01115 [Candidatus Woesebacteria bacterium RIFCSPHIGHO2_01_FULL_39_23]OGM61479.1 MAG: hypothetical protein A2961_00555 [Candidatus Woesebacteria bacterium RIFCSPLOWO2_01_FULL_39_21]
MCELLVASSAKRSIKKISKNHRKAIVSALQEIKEDPFIGKPLTREPTGKFSYKVGVYRIIYKVNTKDKTVFVLSAGHRSTVYN